MIHILGRSSNRVALCLLMTCHGLWTGCATAPVIHSDHDDHAQVAFDRLAHLEVESDRLYQSIANQADVTGFSHHLEAESDLANSFTPPEMERIAHSFVRSLKVMLFDLAPEHFWEQHLAQYYAATVSSEEARQLVEAYDREVLIPTSRVQELRWNFVADRLPELLPVVQARSLRFHITNEAMVPSLLPGDHVIAHRAAYHTAEPQRGDLIIYRYPDENGKLFLHRVIGLPDDRIEIRNQIVSVNEEPLTEYPAQHTDTSSMAGNVRDHLGPVTVPPDTYFVLGDNREESLDSRFLGTVGRELLLGKAVLIYWSVDPEARTPRWERLNQPLSTGSRETLAP